MDVESLSLSKKYTDKQIERVIVGDIDVDALFDEKIDKAKVDVSELDDLI